ncbi:hypothetical protein VTN00DRAFT_5386 [Thermoascus crustaceus]|uniref:uncharacterized protein n=1 Tax=Thermoascus crustaceus TaxID=5088 RepID=UPI0037420540
MTAVFDFITVGGGTAGCLLAARLAASKKKPSVLLVEMGGENDDVADRIPYERFLTAFKTPKMELGYQTTPQAALGGKQIPYARGKGLGGTSAINFTSYTRGPAADYDRWAELVGDEDWGWMRSKERFKKIECFRGSVPELLARYAKPDLDSYGKDGFMKISPPSQWEPETQIVMDALTELGHPINLDQNTGNPIGVAIGISSSSSGIRTTSSSAYLISKELLNLTIWTNSTVSKILFEGKRAVGVETLNGRTASARLEIILCAGAFDTSKLLLLSGIGPADELSALNIKVHHDLPGVGKGLQDHCSVCLTELMSRSFSERVAFELSPEKVEEAYKQWQIDRTGPLSFYYGSNVSALIKDSSWFDMEEFKQLPVEEQRFLRNATVPMYEMVVGGPLVPPTIHQFNTKEDGFLSNIVILMNPQSRGSVTLASANPGDSPLIDVGYMTHPYDRRSLIESVRRAMQLPKTRRLAPYWKGHINVPGSEGDEDIWTFIQENLSPVWHANGTVKMGKPDDKSACVDSKLRVRGLESLRVADMSVCPKTVNNHAQSTAYLIGEFAAEKIIEDYGLEWRNG